MKFKPWDEADRQHCIALQHEFLRCQDAFTEFCTLAMLLHQQGENTWLSYRTYNAYSRFIHHLYEFLLGSFARENCDTDPMKWEDSDPRIMALTQRLLPGRRNAIANGTAPPHENDAAYYQEDVPQGLAAEFRRYRNKVSGHVTHERSGLRMADFFQRNHKFLLLLYRSAEEWWGRGGKNFPDLDEITTFAIRVTQSPIPTT